MTDPSNARWLRIDGITKAYAQRKVLERFSLDLEIPTERGRIVALLGPSGCGKSTLLNILAGLALPDEGSIRLGEEVFNNPALQVPSHKRKIGMVFQGQLLWPHMTMLEHLTFVLNESVRDKMAITNRCLELLDAMHLQHRSAAYPAQLSGGEAQRLALARALIGAPELLLLDEPCANLDANLKREWLALLRKLRRQGRFKLALYVSHDPSEVQEIADEVCVLQHGRAIQRGTMRELLQRPRSPLVVELLGHGATLSVRQSAGTLETAFGIFEPDACFNDTLACPATRLYVPEDDCILHEHGPLQGEVVDCHPYGMKFVLVLARAGETLRLIADERFDPGVTVRFKTQGKSRVLFE